MKKSVFLITLILLVTNCKSQEVIYSDDLPNESDLAIIGIELGKDMNLITFVDDFKNDSISVANDDKLIFKGEISTDPTLGASKGFKFSRKTKYLKIKINNYKEIKIENDNNYRFIYINKEKNKCIIKYAKKPIKFL
ncbi:hypothetical protein [Aquimarina algiphila]|uniref:hypothetical protein n=1 Tax=Aquimarina algiphila TaxID=2047982 RepID=UPI0023312095|nr:hypothetical protein [Aquimarina algiphila]